MNNMILKDNVLASAAQILKLEEKTTFKIF